jgi:hypothetical protein
MHSIAVANISDEWMRTFVYEQGKEGDPDVGPESRFLFRLAEARAALRRGPRDPRRMVADSELETATAQFEEEPTHA